MRKVLYFFVISTLLFLISFSVFGSGNRFEKSEDFIEKYNEKENKVVIYLAKKSSKAKEEIFSIIDSDMVEIQYEDYAKTF